MPYDCGYAIVADRVGEVVNGTVKRFERGDTPWDRGARGRTSSKGRSLAGAGVGVRWQHGPWSAEGTVPPMPVSVADCVLTVTVTW